MFQLPGERRDARDRDSTRRNGTADVVSLLLLFSLSFSPFSPLFFSFFFNIFPRDFLRKLKKEEKRLEIENCGTSIFV